MERQDLPTSQRGVGAIERQDLPTSLCAIVALHPAWGHRIDVAAPLPSTSSRMWLRKHASHTARPACPHAALICSAASSAVSVASQQMPHCATCAAAAQFAAGAIRRGRRRVIRRQ